MRAGFLLANLFVRSRIRQERGRLFQNVCGIREEENGKKLLFGTFWNSVGSRFLCVCHTVL